jgi:probable addiction module antidote protein
MPKLKTRPWDSASYLKTEDDVAAYLDAMFEDGDPATTVHALGVVARWKGMSRIAKKAGLGRESLYKSLSKDGNPSFVTVAKIVQALGFRFALVSDKHEQSRAA